MQNDKKKQGGFGSGSSKEDDISLFRDAMEGVAPLSAANRVVQKHPAPSTIPQYSQQIERYIAEDALSDQISLDIEPGGEWSYLRPELAQQTLRRLRRGHWQIKASLDLHGHTRDQARQALALFLDESVQLGHRCVHIIHGKGISSKNREPVLKIRVGNWLAQRQDVLAFCQAKPEDGGGGAVVVLLRKYA